MSEFDVSDIRKDVAEARSGVQTMTVIAIAVGFVGWIIAYIGYEHLGWFVIADAAGILLLAHIASTKADAKEQKADTIESVGERIRLSGER